MADIAPFRGVRYTPKAGPLEQLVAPPYDVISPAQQQELLDRSPHNAVRLILNPERPQDDDRDSRYTRAAACLRSWIEEGVLAPDPEPALYVYDQKFEIKGRTFLRRGLLSLVKLEELGKGSVYPHENTLAGPKADRLKLMSACKGNLSAIFSVFPDDDGRVAAALNDAVAQAPDTATVRVEAPDGLHTLRPLIDPGSIGHVQALMAPRPLFIADGHHRYETAWAYRERLVQEHGDAGAANYVLMLNVPMNDPGLVILPTHRVLRNVPGLDKDAFTSACEPFFQVEDIPCPVGELRISRRQFIVYFGCSNGCLSLRLKGDDLAISEPGRSRALHMLDVSILRNLIFGKVLGLDPDAFAQGDDIAYVHDAAEAQALVDGQGWAAAFMLNPTGIDEVQHIAAAGERMPPKSTYFYPKLLSGLALHVFGS